MSAEFTSTNPETPDQSIAYAYAPGGNRTQVTTNGITTNDTINELNQYEQAGDTGFTYDADGNLIQKAIGLDITTFADNTDNKLISVDDPEGLTGYQYNGLGDLTAVTKNGIKTHYLLLF